MHGVSRRTLLAAGLGLGAAGLTACSTNASRATFGQVPGETRSPGQREVVKTLVANPAVLDLGGVSVATWAYGDTVPGPLIRATAGDLLRITLDNRLPADSTIHWHGIRGHNHSDGVPRLTQDPVAPETLFTYEFTVPDPGTYFFHPHLGVQLDRALYAPLVVDDPREPGTYDAEWIVVLDDWVDGTGRTPDDVLRELVAAGGNGTAYGGISDLDHGAHGSASGATPWGDAGDVTYPYFLLNGRVPTSPATLNARPGQRVRLRMINAASDTIFAVALGGHRMTVTHSDGREVVPQEVGALCIGMGERYDAVVTLGDGVFPLVARPFGKTDGGQAMGLIRTGAGAAPGPRITPAELGGPVLIGSRLEPAEFEKLQEKAPDATAQLVLEGSMRPYRWAINGAPFGRNAPLTVKAGERLRINVMNMTMMTHPLHLHGHTFALPSGLRKDTVLVGPMEELPIELDADNAGDWIIHCHNGYHAEAGMMIGLRYVT
jgi:multicopper oxidase